MSEPTGMKSEILDTSATKSAENWHQLLQLQAEMFLPHEISFFLSSKDWMNAGTVLDVGCGNGSYISMISDHFSEKSYTAIDVSPELISIAKRRNLRNDIKYELQDFYNLQSKQLFDVILMRLIVQHLDDFHSVLKHASKLLRPGGSLVIIEPDFKNSWNRPETPKFDRLLQGLNDYSVQNQTNRHILSELDSVARSTDDWTITQDVLSSVPYVGSSIDSSVLRLYKLWIDILDNSQIISLQFREVRSELQTWSERDDAYAQIGIRFLHLKHVSSKTLS